MIEWSRLKATSKEPTRAVRQSSRDIVSWNAVKNSVSCELQVRKSSWSTVAGLLKILSSGTVSIEASRSTSGFIDDIFSPYTSSQKLTI